MRLEEVEVKSQKEIEKEEGELEEEAKIDEFTNYEQEYNKSQLIEDPSERLKELSKIVQKLNNELVEIKLKHSKLLNLREQVVNESNKIINDLCQEYDERKILYYFITHHDRNISTISEAMEMREKVIREIFQNLRNLLFSSNNLKYPSGCILSLPY